MYSSTLSGSAVGSSTASVSVIVLVADGKIVIVAVGGSGVLVASSTGVWVAGCSGAVSPEHAPSKKRTSEALMANRI
jgi:hypothetical protein